MLERIRNDWKLLKSGRPGERFGRYHRARRERGFHPFRRAAAIGAAVLVVMLGVILLPAPGPGLVVIALGAAALAAESSFAARMLDRCESGAYALVQRWRGRGSHS